MARVGAEDGVLSRCPPGWKLPRSFQTASLDQIDKTKEPGRKLEGAIKAPNAGKNPDYSE